jgi:hypothetical protein
VWFDVEGGLEQDGEWDAKIRQQSKDCVLFIAVVSANTQSRLKIQSNPLHSLRALCHFAPLR